MLIGYITGCHIIGLFTAIIHYLVEHHPRLYCALFSTWIVHTMTIYLMYLAFFKLLMVVSTERFVNLNHEAVAFKLNIAAVFIVTGDFFVKLIRGSLCFPKIVTVMTTKRFGVPVNQTVFAKDETNPLEFPLVTLEIALAFFFYALSVIIKNKLYPTCTYFEKDDGVHDMEMPILSLRRTRDLSRNRISPTTETGNNGAKGHADPRALGFQIHPIPVPALTFVSQPALPTSQHVAATRRVTLQQNPSVKRTTKADASSDVEDQHGKPQEQSSDSELTSPSTVQDSQRKLALSPRYLGKPSTSRRPNSSWDVKDLKCKGSNDSSTSVVRVSPKQMQSYSNVGGLDEFSSATPIQLDDENTEASANPTSLISVSHEQIHSVPSVRREIGENYDQQPANSRRVTSPVPQPARVSPLEALFQKVSFSLVIVLFLMTFLFLTFHEKNSFVAWIVVLGERYLFQCLPMYWVLMVEECYAQSLRRVKRLLADYFNIYWD